MLLNFQMGDVLSLKSVGLEEQEYHLEPKLQIPVYMDKFGFGP